MKSLITITILIISFSTAFTQSIAPLAVNSGLNQVTQKSVPVVLQNELKTYQRHFSKDINDRNNLETNSDYPTNENYYNFTSASALELGRGFYSYDLERIKQSPFTFDLNNIEGDGAFNTTFDVQIVFNKYQLQKVLEYDIKLEARVFSVSANAYLNVLNETKFDESSLVVVIKGSCEYGRTSLKNIKLKKDAKKIVKRDVDKFRSIYGTKFPIMIRRGSAVFFVLQITNISEELKNQLKTGMSASYSGLAVSGKLDVTLRKELHEKKVKNEMSIRILSNGGTGIGSFNEIIKKLEAKPDAENSFVQIREGLADYFKSFEVKNAATLGYFCADYKDVHRDLKSIAPDPYTVLKERCLARIVRLYRDKENELERLSMIQQNIDPISNYLTSNQRERLPKDIEKLRNYQDVLRRLHLFYSQENPSSTDFEQLEIPIVEVDLWKEISVAVNGRIDILPAARNLQIVGANVQDVVLYIESYDPNNKLNNRVALIAGPNEFLIGASLPPEITFLNNQLSVQRTYITRKVNSKFTHPTTRVLGEMVHAKGAFGSELILVVRTRYGTEQVLRIGKVRTDGNANYPARSFLIEFYDFIA